jgi:hypothetical protein
MPNLPDLYNLLVQLGIPASLTVHPFDDRSTYPDAATAVEECGGRLGVPRQDTAAWRRLDAAVRARLVPHGDEVAMGTATAYRGVLWWEAGTRVDPRSLYA